MKFLIFSPSWVKLHEREKPLSDILLHLLLHLVSIPKPFIFQSQDVVYDPPAFNRGKGRTVLLDGAFHAVCANTRKTTVIPEIYESLESNGNVNCDHNQEEKPVAILVAPTHRAGNT